MISRTLVIVMALGAAAFQASRAAWPEAVGLAGLGLGLLILRTAPKHRLLAWAAFSVTAAAVVVVLMRSGVRS